MCLVFLAASAFIGGFFGAVGPVDFMALPPAFEPLSFA
jgi:hypothetical protein